MSEFCKTKHGVAICPFFGWQSENIEGLGHSEDDVDLTFCSHPKNPNDCEGNCNPGDCPLVVEKLPPGLVGDVLIDGFEPGLGQRGGPHHLD